MTLILRCSCAHDYQDRRYGLGQRVHNACGAKKAGQLRCTVCGTTRDGGPKK